jgi:DNA polymerase III alpha subunit (gram-positive type)
MNFKDKIICIDIETTDINPDIGSIIQISALKLDNNFEYDEYDVFNEYIKPLDNHRSKEAMKVNNISEEILSEANNLNDVLLFFENYCDDYKILSAWGNYFDIPFLRKQYEKINSKWPFNHKTYELKTIALWEMAKKDISLKHGSLIEIINETGMVFEGNQHDALDDIKNTVNLIKKLI